MRLCYLGKVAISVHWMIEGNYALREKVYLRERCKKRGEKLTNVSFMYVCVAENVELLVFFYFFFAHSP